MEDLDLVDFAIGSSFEIVFVFFCELLECGGHG